MFRCFRKGFTLVELSISIAFIAILSITITLLTTNIVASYQRGLTIKQINTTGTEIINDLKSSISNSSAKSLTDLCGTTYANETARNNCNDDKAQNFVSLVRYGVVDFRGESMGTMPIYGAFCTGTYSYIWNTGYYFSDEHNISLAPAKLIYKDGSDDQKVFEGFRLLKIFDISRSVCVAMTLDGSADASSDKNYQAGLAEFSGTIDISDFGNIVEEPLELLSQSNEFDLALYGLAVARPAQDSLTRNMLYSGYFILATVRGGVNILTDSNYCSAPDEYDSSAIEYCAINKFNFAIQANGE